MKQYALLENGSIHTADLNLKDAKEMLERHSRIFDTINWQIAPMSEVKDRERLIGFLERQRQNAIRYHAVK